MNTVFKNALRKAVVLTSRIPPFSWVSRGIYLWTIRHLTRVITRKEFVTSFYLRGSCAVSDFEPGYSDIDFSIVVQDDTTQEQLIALSQLIFEEKNRPFYRLAEIIGEFETYTHTDVQRLSFAWYSRRYKWKHLTGAEINPSTETIDEHEWLSIMLLHLVLFNPMCRSYQGHPKAARRRAKRLGAKIEIAPGNRKQTSSLADDLMEVLRIFDERFAAHVDQSIDPPTLWITDHVGPHIGQGDDFHAEYHLIDESGFPDDAETRDSDSEKLIRLPPVYLLPNTMRYVSQNWEDTQSPLYARQNHGGARFLWRGSLLNNIPDQTGIDDVKVLAFLRGTVNRLANCPLMAPDALQSLDTSPLQSKTNYEQLKELFSRLTRAFSMAEW